MVEKGIDSMKSVLEMWDRWGKLRAGEGKGVLVRRSGVWVVVGLFGVYIGWRVFCTLPFGQGGWSLAAGILLLGAEVLGAVTAVFNLLAAGRKWEYKLPKIMEEGAYPEVDILVVTHNESEELLFKTINACLYMDYPDQRKVHIYLCDDGERAQMRRLARRMGILYLGVKGNQEAKAGNLNYAIAHTNSPYLVTFDADMIPRRDFLMQTIPYFLQQQDKPVGFVQTPQSFYNPDLFQFHFYAEEKIPNEQDYFFQSVNISRNRSNSVIYAGSNTVILRQALEEAGGIVTGTLTEDLATGIRMQEAGYQGIAIAKVLAHGLAPMDFASLLKQRERWGRGCIQTLKQVKIFRNQKLSGAAKWGYLFCGMYWWSFWSRLIYLLAPIWYSVFGLKVVEASVGEIALFWLPPYLLYHLILKKMSDYRIHTRWSGVVDTILAPFLIVPILKESIGIRLHSFVVTQKDGKKEEKNGWYYLPFVVLLVLSVLGIGNSIHGILKDHLSGNWLVIYWLCVNLYGICMGIYFLLGRRGGQDIRVQARDSVVVRLNHHLYSCETKWMSERKLVLVSADEIPVMEQHVMHMWIQKQSYSSSLMAICLQKGMQDGKYEYDCKIIQTEEKDWKEYLQILYDREHTMARRFGESSGFFEDLSQIIHKKQEEHRMHKIVRTEKAKRTDYFDEMSII